MGKAQDRTNLVVLMRHTQPAGGNPLTWDASGTCQGESMLTAEGKAHARKIGEEFAKHGIKPLSSALLCAAAGKPRELHLEEKL